MIGEGPGPQEKPPTGILIGESPGRDEHEHGRPFVGNTGRALDGELLQANLLRSRLYITNAVACLPPIGKTKPMMRKAAACCRPFLASQLRRFNPKTPVFAMGSLAFYALTGRDKGVMNARGFVRKNWSLESFFDLNDHGPVKEKMEKTKRSFTTRRRKAWMPAP